MRLIEGLFGVQFRIQRFGNFCPVGIIAYGLLQEFGL